MTVEELLGRISARELAEWQAFSLLEPFGELRADLRAGVVAATLANVHRDPAKKPEPFTPQEFMPGYETKAYPLEEVERWFEDVGPAGPALQAAHLTDKILATFGRFRRAPKKEG